MFSRLIPSRRSCRRLQVLQEPVPVRVQVPEREQVPVQAQVPGLVPEQAQAQEPVRVQVREPEQVPVQAQVRVPVRCKC